MTAPARLRAERELPRRHRAEYRTLALDLGHASAVQAMVDGRAAEYHAIYRSVLSAGAHMTRARGHAQWGRA